MGYGPIKNGRQQPISRWQGSWAQQEQARRERPQQGWPLGWRPGEAVSKRDSKR